MNNEEYRKAILRAKRSNEIIFAGFACLFLIAAIAFCTFKYHHTFSKSKWDINRESRYKIVNDMLDKYQLIGMSELDVIQILGEEDSEQTSFKISRKYFPPDSTLVYYLGVDFMDNNWLILSLDDGIVTEYCLDVS
ncbi:MAG: hypothetical protein HDR17_05375 [Lachnospiraceae bacterium]|nr:hypothetical protein [Lachnospiraceae bacterium]